MSSDAAVKAERGTLDIVLANAGEGSPLPLGKITAEHIDDTFNTTVMGTIFAVQHALPLMREGGSIILTGSSAGTTGAPGFSADSASKAAVRKRPFLVATGPRACPSRPTPPGTVHQSTTL